MCVCMSEVSICLSPSQRDSMQLPPSPLVNVRRFDYPNTPTPTNSTPTHSLNRLSKISNTSNSSNSPQLKPRVSSPCTHHTVHKLLHYPLLLRRCPSLQRCCWKVMLHPNIIVHVENVVSLFSSPSTSSQKVRKCGGHIFLSQAMVSQ